MHPARLRSCLAATLLLGMAGACGEVEPPPPHHPDVLLVVVDTLRADRLGCYGYERPTSPVIDALAERGAVFTRASAQCPWTLPSMASMVTGRYPTAHQERPDPAVATIAECFKSAGYRTVGVTTNSLLDPGMGFERGFDVYVPRANEQGERRKPGHFEAMASWVDEAIVEAVEPGPDGERPPLFLYLQPSDPHAPYQTRRAYRRSLPPETVPPILPEGWQQEQLAALGPPAPEGDPGWAAALGELVGERNAYDHEVLFTDQALGKLLQRLAQLGVGDDLVVAIVSDHGEGLWEHVLNAPEEQLREMPPKAFFFQSHGYDLSEQALRTPFILSGPGIPAGLEIDEPVENVDLLPTLIELCGLERPGELHGVDLGPLMRGEVTEEEWRTETYAYVLHEVAVRDEEAGLKLVLPTPYGEDRGLDEPLLFDLTADPLERVNVFAERPEDARRLTERVIGYWARYEPGDTRLEGEAAAELRRRLRANGYAGAFVGDDEQEGEGLPVDGGGGE